MRPSTQTALIALIGLTAACAHAVPAIELSPVGHGSWTRTPGPRAIAWRANALSAPCALSCRARTQGDITCGCSAVDSIYFSQLNDGLQLGMADDAQPAPSGQNPPPAFVQN